MDVSAKGQIKRTFDYSTTVATVEQEKHTALVKELVAFVGTNMRVVLAESKTGRFVLIERA